MEKMERRLTAILMADVVGYSRLMSDNEESTVGDLKALHETARNIINENGGRVVDLTGDSILAEFPSVVGAVKSAVSMCKTAPDDALHRPARRLQIRVGVHQAEITQDAEKLYGDGINVAARLQALADPGGVAISGRVYEDIHGKLELNWVDTGERSLKNIARPVRVYKLDSAAAPLLDRSPLDLPAKPSIAVLPFQNMSGDPEQDYFADGMVEDITTALSRLRWLFVVARNSSFTYKGRSVDVKQVGRELGVRYVLEGSVRKAGTRLRITAQLIDASAAIHIWADRFDGDLVDVFELQDQIASRVVGSIGHQVERAEIQRVIREPTQNLDAHDCYLRGLAYFYGFSRSTNKQALPMFESAMRLDPDYASAFGMAARCYIQRRGFGWVEDPVHELDETIRLSVRAAESGARMPSRFLPQGRRTSS